MKLAIVFYRSGKHTLKKAVPITRAEDDKKRRDEAIVKSGIDKRKVLGFEWRKE